MSAIGISLPIGRRQQRARNGPFKLASRNTRRRFGLADKGQFHNYKTRTAVALLGLQHFSTLLAWIKANASIDRYGLAGGVPASRARASDIRSDLNVSAGVSHVVVRRCHSWP